LCIWHFCLYKDRWQIDIFQDDKTEVENKEFCRNNAECGNDTDLDSIDIFDSDIDTEVFKVFTVSINLWVVAIKSCSVIEI